MNARCAASFLLACSISNLPVIAEPIPPMRPTSVPELERFDPLFPGATYNPAIPTPDSLLGFPLGRRAVNHAEIEKCFQAWGNGNPRTRLFEYARTYEGRALYYMIISSEANMQRLDEIKADVGRLADPREVSQADSDRIAGSIPAVAWLAYGIHGDENSPCDGALAVAHHLAACTDQEVLDLLDHLVIIIDPLQNPDGHDRFLKQVAEHTSNAPSLDDQSLLHSGYWPFGRTNHYNFDLNRDWIFAVNPETRGRIAAAGAWHPLFFIDGHEMGSQDTFLMNPPRDPWNPNFPARRRHWAEIFAAEQGAAFDKFGWRYYAGEWNEGWYPGYSDSWAGFRGAIGMLFEQAAIGGDGVRRSEGTVMSYREAVHHYAVASLSHLHSLDHNRAEIIREFMAERRAAIAPDSSHAQRVFAIVPGANRSRLDRFTDLMRLQGFEMFVLKDALKASATDRLGVSAERDLPAGTILIPNRQPEAYLLSTMLEFDPRMPAAFLQDERRELLRFDRSKLYDVTGWSLPMLHDVEAYALNMGSLPAGAEPLTNVAPPTPPVVNPQTTTAFVIDGADDRSVGAAAQLMERGVKVRVTDRPITLAAHEFARGSVVVTRVDNQGFAGEIEAELERVCSAQSVQAVGVESGWGAGDLPDIGGEHFILLEQPRIAVVSRDSTDFYDFGSIWHTLDQRLGIRASYLSGDDAGSADLRRYNVIVLPGTYGGSAAMKDLLDSLKPWVEQGGTLIAIGSSAAAIAAKPEEEDAETLSAVRTLPDVLEDVTAYSLAVIREWEGRTAAVDEAALWSQTAPLAQEYPWTPVTESDPPSKEELERRDEWQQLFMPQGAILACRADDKHFLTFGCGPYVPVMYGDAPVLMSAPPVETPIRVGVYAPASSPPEPPKKPAPKKGDADDKEDADEEAPPPMVAWAPVPEGQELRLRMSGLLWPEAATRIANSAYLTRESAGRGQVILFASSPTFRGSTLGTMRLLTNAMIYGPGCGASHPIEP